MDFDEHDEGIEEMALPVGSSDHTVTGNSDLGGGGGAKMGGVGESASATAGMAVRGSGHRKTYGGRGRRGKYRECLKNHAVGIGGHAVDGCGEFMAAGEEGTLDALRCAACGCHRNFHRREEEGGGAGGGATEVIGYHPQFSPYNRAPGGYFHPHHSTVAALASPQQQQHRPAPLALPSARGGGGHSRDEQEETPNPMVGVGGGVGRRGGVVARKRFRTKFTQEQKEKMLAFAEWLGWRIQRHDDAAVQKFCEETCVKRHVLKVWMHNNKHTLGKKP
ncbi:hypothetical protein C4D60_Mb06t03530 [Musa balbisiana]|uniref:ZF-HD dimerization-type domain-containing protein n=1 Tax=Musa balbisiana TaxID=52838 RepID=A0A4S8IK98_MUSBA|nr:hypothetical protein C4D60_Mb06t03530 [Musa balbisiana]